MHRDHSSPAHQQLGHLAAVLNLQARSRRNALQAARLLHVRRAQQREADDAVRAGAIETFPPTPTPEVEPIPGQLSAAR